MSHTPKSFELTVELAGAVQFRRRMDGIAEKAEDLSPALERMAEIFRKHEEDVFSTQGSALDGAQSWVALSKRYAAWKAKHYPGLRILEREGLLKAAMTKKGAPGNIHEVDKLTLVVGGRRPAKGGRDLASTHHFGSEDGKHPPARKIIALHRDVKRDWIQELRRHLNTEA